MLKWLKYNAKNIAFGLAAILYVAVVPSILSLYVPAIVTTILAYFVLPLIFGFIVGFVSRRGRYDGGVMVDPEEQASINETSYDLITCSKRNSLQTREQLNSEHHMAPNKLEPEVNLSTVYANIAGFIGSFFNSSSKKNKSISRRDQFMNALLKYENEVDIQNSEISLITNELDVFNQESYFLFEEINKRSSCLTVSILDVVTEQTNVNRSRTKEELTNLLHEFRALVDSYPKSGFTYNSTIECIEKNIEARREHHANVLMIAELLLPNLSSFLNETRLMHNTAMKPGLR